MKRRKIKGTRRSKCVVERVREGESDCHCEQREVKSSVLHFKVTEFVPWLQTCTLSTAVKRHISIYKKIYVHREYFISMA